MDARSVALLEFPLVRARLADQTSFPPSRRLAEALQPTDDPVLVARGARRDRPGAGAPLRAARRRHRRGARHRPGRRARSPRRTPRSGAVPRDRRHARRCRASCDRPRRRPPAAAPRSRPAAPSAARAALHARAVLRPGRASCSTRRRRGWAGSARRSGSPTTGCAGGSTRSSASELGGALQEPIVTLRNGRYVVPVKAEARSRVKGIVHDASGSGQTLFVEPLVVVELGNAWREAQVARARGDRAHPRRAVGARRGQRGRAARDARGAGPVRLLGGQGAARRRDGRRSRPRRRTGPRSILLVARAIRA